jgi:flagellar biosynthesis regulator FlaF
MNDQLARELIDNLISIRVQMERQTEMLDKIEKHLDFIAWYQR